MYAFSAISSTQTLVLTFMLSSLVVNSILGANDVSDITEEPVIGEITEAPSEPGPKLGEDVLDRPIDQGMWPVYAMVKFLLEKVMILNSINDLHAKVNLADLPGVQESLKRDWQMWISHYSSYFACGIIALLFAIALPITGCAICACRCKGRCGGKADPMDSKHSRCIMFTCNTLLLFFSTLLLLGTTAAFIGNQLVFEQTRNEGMSHKFQESLANFKTFTRNSKQTYRNILERDFTDARNDVTLKLISLPESTQELVADKTNISIHWKEIVNHVAQIDDVQMWINTSLIMTKNLSKNGEGLRNTLQELKIKMEANLTSCSDSICMKVNETLMMLDVGINFTNAYSLSDAKITIHNLTNGNDTIYTKVEKGQSQLNKLQSRVNESTFGFLPDIVKELDNFEVNLNKFLNSTIQSIELINLTEAHESVTTNFEPWAKYVGDIFFYAVIGMNCVVLIIVALCFLALLFGVYGERAGDDAAYCNRARGSNILRAVVILFFVVMWAFMLCTAGLFLFGGLGQTEVCRHMVRPSESKGIEVMSDIITHNLNLSTDYYTIYKNCENDLAFYSALQLDKKDPNLNISSVMNLSNYKFDDYFNQMKHQNFNISKLEILNKSLNETLFDLEKTLKNIDYESFHDEINKNITTVNLIEFSQFLNNSAANVSADVANLFQEYSKRFQNVSIVYEQPIAKEMEKLANTLYNILKYVASFDTNEILSLMETSQAAINEYEIKESVAILLDRNHYLLEFYCRDSETQIRTSAGRCQLVYTSLSTSVTSVCVQFLYPFNAIWYSYGWFIFFSIPIIFVCFFLITQYRKELHFEPFGLTNKPGSVHRERRSSSRSNRPSWDMFSGRMEEVPAVEQELTHVPRQSQGSHSPQLNYHSRPMENTSVAVINDDHHGNRYMHSSSALNGADRYNGHDFNSRTGHDLRLQDYESRNGYRGPGFPQRNGPSPYSAINPAYNGINDEDEEDFASYAHRLRNLSKRKYKNKQNQLNTRKSNKGHENEAYF